MSCLEWNTCRYFSIKDQATHYDSLVEEKSNWAKALHSWVLCRLSFHSLPQEDSDFERERSPPTPPPARKLSRRGHSFKLACIGKQESDENPLMRKVGQPLRLTQSQVNQVHPHPISFLMLHEPARGLFTFALTFEACSLSWPFLFLWSVCWELCMSGFVVVVVFLVLIANIVTLERYVYRWTKTFISGNSLG